MSYQDATTAGPQGDLVRPWPVPQQILSTSELTANSPSDWNMALVSPGQPQGTSPSPLINASGIVLYAHTESYGNGPHEPVAMTYTMSFTNP